MAFHTPHPTIIALSQLESMLDLGESSHLDAIKATTPNPESVGPSMQLNPAALHRPDNEWVRFEAEVRSKHAVALIRLRRLWETGAAAEDAQQLLRLLEIEEYTRCQAFQACVVGEERSHVYQNTVRSILEKLLGKLETHSPQFYQAAAGCLSDYLSALNHHCEICVVPPPPSALPAIDEGSAQGYQMTGYSSASERSEVRSEATRSEDTLSVCSSTMQGGESAAAAHQPPPQYSPQYIAMESERRNSGEAYPPLESFRAPAGAKLSSEERAERRRDQNKKAASRYRSKKTATSSSLMGENAALRQQVAMLTSQSAVLCAENKLLTQQVAFLQKLLSGGGGQQQAPMPVENGVPLAVSAEPTEEEQQNIEMLLETMQPQEPAGMSSASSSVQFTAGGGLPAELRCANAFGAATSADTDLLGFS